MSHTPGKWEPWYDLSRVMNDIVIEAENEATARLIASAPDLLEACKESLAYLRECGLDELTAPESELMYKLESVIQKAEGDKT